ncbi:MAG: hypothetical protein FJZ90_11150 [Chloroflexi bacterium]|nr:hypothetical protein [Chloroflexota bacterium]
MMSEPGEGAWRGVVPLLQVGDLTETLDYYREVLGFTMDFVWPDEDAPKWAMASRPGVSFMFTVDLGTSSSPFIAEKGNGVVFYIVTDDLDAVYDELLDKGAIIAQEMVAYGDRRQFSVADPNGYVITFSEAFVS